MEAWTGRLLERGHHAEVFPATTRGRETYLREELAKAVSGLGADPAEYELAERPVTWRRKNPAQLVVQLEAITAAAAAGLNDHDRWLNQRTLLTRKLDGRRATSKLPALLDYALTRPIVSAGMIAEELGITPRAAQDLVAALGLREATGRRRYRAWGIP